MIRDQNVLIGDAKKIVETIFCTNNNFCTVFQLQQFTGKSSITEALKAEFCHRICLCNIFLDAIVSVFHYTFHV